MVRRGNVRLTRFFMAAGLDLKALFSLPAKIPALLQLSESS
jgi:hypothetical protein